MKKYNGYLWAVVILVGKIIYEVNLLMTKWNFTTDSEYGLPHVMTLGQRETDNINPMITISKQIGYLHQVYKTDLGQVNPGKYNCNNQIITLSH